MIMYHKESTLLKVNEVRRDLFARKTSLWKIFHQHRMLFSNTQGGLSIKVAFGIQVSIKSKMFLHVKAGASWTKNKNTWKPVWITIHEAARSCNELIRCGCRSKRGCSSHYICIKSGLACIDLCNCTCEF